MLSRGNQERNGLYLVSWGRYIMIAMENSMKKIFALLHIQTGHDFSQYKTSTIFRRINRRMAVNQVDDIELYIGILQQNAKEIEALFQDLLIGVTNFFRDVESFKSLEEKVIPQIFTAKKAGGVIRVWSTGCSTGEEAYSLAILLQEKMETLKQSFTIQVFATDIDSNSIATARSGLYSASIAADITPERLARFFTVETLNADGFPSSYRIRRNIRDILVFSKQDIIKDPPISRVDMIVCRNLLIYMDASLQKKLIPLFHYALAADGILFLGSSETVGEYLDLFTVIDRKAKIFQRKETPAGHHRLSFLDLQVSEDVCKLSESVKNPLHEITGQELQSTNEELQSTNEELQSINEELTTVNTELQCKVVDLCNANNDMNNLLAGNGIATIYVDTRMNILRFTPSATQLINLIPHDIGRPLAHILSNINGYTHLVVDARKVLETLKPKEMEVQSNESRWFILRMQPYRTLDNVIEGVVFTFVDITEKKKAEEVLKESEVFFRNLYSNCINAVSINEIVMDADMKVIDFITLQANPAFETLTGLQVDDVIGRKITDLYPDVCKTDFIEICGRVALTGEPASFKQRTPDGKVYFNGYSYKVGQGKFALVFEKSTFKLNVEFEK